MPSQQSPFASPERLINWVYGYRKHPDPQRVPAAVHAMDNLGIFGDEEKGGFCIGFLAGVLGENPKLGTAFVLKMLPLPDKEQGAIVQAIAYSGRPDWRELLQSVRPSMPLRQPLIDDYLNGKRVPLMQVDLINGTEVVYELWGYYVATGDSEPVIRIMQALRWSRRKDDGSFSWGKMLATWQSDPSDVDKITVGATAKWTLASYAERNRELLPLYRAEAEQQPEEIADPLKDVIAAADAFESERVRKDQMAAIEDAQKKKMSDEAGMSKMQEAGSIAIATGCVAATALSQAEIAVPCIIGGALYTGAVKMLH